MHLPARSAVLSLALLAHLGVLGCTSLKSSPASSGKDGDDFAAYVWPAPPDEARIRLTGVYSGRSGIESGSTFEKILIGTSPKDPVDVFKKPFAAAFDASGRILVTDPGHGVLYRIDRKERRLDILGTRGTSRLSVPMGLDVSNDGSIWVTDIRARRVFRFDAEGNVLGVFGKEGDLQNPTDVAVAPDGKRAFIADSKAHRILVLDIASGSIAPAFGTIGTEPGQFHFPTSLAFSPTGELFVVDQMNSRVQILTESGEVIDVFGNLGVGYANFVRPKDVAIDRLGYVYVTDAAFNNVQIFDDELQLLTFVGRGGYGPGAFQQVAGVATFEDEFVLVDQLNARIQTFRFLAPRPKN